MTHFTTDCRAINDACTKNPQAVLSAGIMVLLSIQQPFHTIGAQMDHVRTAGRKSHHLWGFKRAGYDYLMANYKDIRWQAIDARLGKVQHCDFVRDLMAVPGMGIAKASFFAQLLVGEGACLDQHNLASLGLGVRAFDFDKTRASIKTCNRKIDHYIETWRAIGDSDYWWSTWCDTVAAYHDTFFRDGAEVSALHRVCLNYAFDETEAPF